MKQRTHNPVVGLQSGRFDGLHQSRGDQPRKTVPRSHVRPTLRSLIALAAIISVATQGYGNPVQTVDLSGTWNFTPNNGNPTTIQVPGGGWKKQGFSASEADYSKTISIPSIGQPQVTKIKFGAVNYQADLYVDGNFVASSTQSHTPATFDITDYVTPGSSAAIRVHVKGQNALMSGGRSLVPNGAGSWSQTLPDGIFRSAELQLYPQVFIEDVFVRTYVSSTALYYDVWLRNASSSSKSVTLSGSLDSWNNSPWSYPSLPSQQYSLPADSVTKVTVGPVNWNLGSGSYWWPNVPYQSGYKAQLHNLDLSISGGGSHSTSVRFGFRECTQGPDGQGNTCYFLNGTRVNFRGDSLQGANYDRIDNNGQGNAYDTFPGFLPGQNGWTKAVDNYQRLNYNFVRIHQIPASPYMLDVCDEMGLMIMDETGIRGAGDQQDFNLGWDNMVNHVKQLFTRDRNHPSVVRESISNEPDNGSTDSVGFEDALYWAAMEVDGTRPISIDAAWYDFDPSSQYGGLGYANFNAIRHYGYDNSSWGRYTDEVFARSDRPYGSGEHIWHHDNTKFGFTWFGTSTQAMRSKGASDVRPYTLLSGWASVIPGVTTSEMRLEEPPWDQTPLYPLYGENNLSNPWNNYQIQRIQAGFNPVMVADASYWDWNKTSNANGDWPAYAQTLPPASQVTRVLNIYNDTFSGGTTVDVDWELRQGTASGTLLDSGTISAYVPYGYVGNENLTFNTPNAPNGTILYLVLSANKNGVEMFREDKQYFVLSSASSYPLVNAGFEQPAAGKISIGFDGGHGSPDVPGWQDYGTMSDSGIEDPGFPAHSGNYCAYLKGRNTGEGGIYQMTGHTIQAGDTFTVGYWAKIDAEGDPGWIGMTVVLFWNQANNSNFEIDWSEAWPLTDTWTYYEVTFDANSAPGCIGGELGIEFINTVWDWGALDDITLTINNGSNDTTPPLPPTGLAANPGSNLVSLDWSDNSEADLNGYNVYRSTSSGGPYSQIASLLNSSNHDDSNVNNGTTYYYVVTAEDNSGNESGYSSEVSATPDYIGNPGENYAASDSTAVGTVSGNYTGTYYSDNSYEAITEEESGGNPAKRYSYLDHTWAINIGSGGNPVLHVEAYHTANSEGDDFVFAYSTDNVNFTDVLTVTKTSDNNSEQTASLPGTLTGTVYIRVTDTDRGQGHRNLDTVYVDKLFIDTSGGGGPSNNNPTFNTDPITKSDATEGSSYSGTIAGSASDPDGDPLSYSKVGGPSWLNVASSGSLSGTPGAGDVGLNSWVVQVSDGQGGTDTATLNITVNPAGPVTDIYISDIAMSSAAYGGGRYSGIASITVKDDSGAVVPNATVSVNWSGVVSGSASASTDGSGVVVFESSKKKNGGTFTVTVTGVTASGHSYNSGLNVETSDSVTAP